MEKKKQPRGTRIITVPFNQDIHVKIIDSTSEFRKFLDEQIKLNKNIFPVEIDKGYDFHGFIT